MSKPRKGATDSGVESSKPARKQHSEGSRPDKNDGPSATNRQSDRSKLADLPPNGNIRKHPDEVYGDTEIPERKQDI